MKTSNDHFVLITLIVCSLFLVCVAFALGLMYSQTRMSVNDAAQNIQEDVVPELTEEQDPYTFTPETVSHNEELSMVWLTLAAQTEMTPIEPMRSFAESESMKEFSGLIAPKAYKLGTVIGGTYDGYTLSYHTLSIAEMGTWTFGVYVLDKGLSNEKPVVLNVYGVSSGGFGLEPLSTEPTTETLIGMSEYRRELAQAMEEGVTFEMLSTIPSFAHATTQTDSLGRSYVFEGVWNHAHVADFDVNEHAVVAVVPEGNLRLIPRTQTQEGVNSTTRFENKFFTVREDGRVLLYELDQPVWDETSTDAMQLLSLATPTGSFSGEYYKGRLGGCGIYPETYVVDPAHIGTLTVFGTVNGTTVYTTNDYGRVHFDSLRQSWAYMNLREEFEDVATAEAKAVAIERVAQLSPPPFLFFVDSYGRTVQMTSTAMVGGFECGKPVIYLYPEETTDLEVYVAPKGGFSYTDPVYNNGWRVTATPDGMLTNRDDGTAYTYLFWEGRGGSYVAPEKYWVVAKADVPSFLTSTLAKMGFTSREIADFNEFWLPRMTDAPYYKIGFHGNAVMDRLAPLTLSQKPDSVLRVLMDFEELEAPIPSNPPVIRPFVRKGFVVTEWGGVLKGE